MADLESKPIQTIRLSDECERIAICGGPYSNFGAVTAFLKHTQAISHRFCLGDLGGFGPFPNQTIELLRSAQVTCLQGNYDHAVGYGERDCGCGYSDPRDQYFAQLSYDYTYSHTHPEHRTWMQTLPTLIRLQWRDLTLLLCHGSPTQVNEFIWESETDDVRILQDLNAFEVDGICATHSGIPWIRSVNRSNQSPGFWFNVGVLGRPAHEGKPSVYYGLLEFPQTASMPSPRLVPLDYDVAPVTAAMQAEGLPQEFCDSLEQGIWTTCAEILPPAEKLVRVRGRL